jgi:hypothetical protein
LKHAFLSEALRAIGSDDDVRFKQLLDCGISAYPTTQTDFGGKDLMGWCIEMNASKCIHLLREASMENDYASETDPQQTISIVPSSDKTHLVAKSSILNQIAENEALFSALTSILDNLADEVSITRDLLMENGSNDGFLSQIRTLKFLREQKESDIEHWTSCLSNASNDLERSILEWKNLGGGHDILLHFSQKIKGVEKTMDDESLSVELLNSQLDLSESKVQRLRSTISELASENSKNLIHIERKGLIGAVQLARSLRDKLREREDELQELKSQEEYCRMQLNFVRSKISSALLEKESAEIIPNQESTRTGVAADTSFQCRKPLTHLVDSSIPTPDTADDALIEAENCGVSTEADDLELLEELNDELRKVAGENNANSTIMLRPHQNLPLKIWDLILRIMGLGRHAVWRSLNLSEGDGLSRIIIV